MGATVKLTSAEGGFLFAVLNPLETVVQLGVQLTPGADGDTNVTLLYTDSEVHFTSQRLATFAVPDIQVSPAATPGCVIVIPDCTQSHQTVPVTPDCTPPLQAVTRHTRLYPRLTRLYPRHTRLYPRHTRL